jgi:hypothetical protein
MKSVVVSCEDDFLLAAALKSAEENTQRQYNALPESARE